MTELLGKDFKMDLGYIPRKSNEAEEFVFKAVGANDKYEIYRVANEALISQGFGNMSATTNKPNLNEGLWVSPCIGKFSVWGGVSVYLEIQDQLADYYYKVIPDADCRILNIDSIQTYLDFERKYDFRWELIAKDYDFIFVSSYEVMTKNDTIETNLDLRPKYHLMMFGWSCISGVFLNKKFTLGEKVKYDAEFSNVAYYRFEEAI